MSQSIVNLGKYGTATLRDPSDVPERARRVAHRSQIAVQAFMEELKTRGEVPADLDVTEVDEPTTRRIGLLTTLERPELMEDLNDAVIVALVEQWPFPAPVTLDGVRELPGAAYDALRTACQPLGPLVLPNLTAVTPPEEGNTPFGN